jgi:hypothetical protein
MQDNPFEAPERDEPPPGSDDAVALHDAGSVMLGAFLGSVLGGAILLHKNAVALQEPQPGKYLAMGAGGAVAMALLPEQVPSIVYTLAAVYVCGAWARSAQGPRMEASLAAGVPRVSRWHAAGWALLMLIPTALITLAVAFPIMLVLEG